MCVGILPQGKVKIRIFLFFSLLIIYKHTQIPDIFRHTCSYTDFTRQPRKAARALGSLCACMCMRAWVCACVRALMGRLGVSKYPKAVCITALLFNWFRFAQLFVCVCACKCVFVCMSMCAYVCALGVKIYP